MSFQSDPMFPCLSLYCKAKSLEFSGNIFQVLSKEKSLKRLINQLTLQLNSQVLLSCLHSPSEAHQRSSPNAAVEPATTRI